MRLAMRNKTKSAISINANKWDDFLAAMKWFRETNRSKIIEEMIDAFIEIADNAKQKGVKRMPRLEFVATNNNQGESK